MHPHGMTTPCFNTGIMTLRPNSTTASRIERAELSMREAQDQGHTVGVRGQESTTAPQFARCPQGTDQPPLNLALNEFETMPLVQLTPLVPCMAANGLADGDTFHAFTGLTPLRMGSSCEPHGVLQGKTRCELPTDMETHGLYKAIGCADTVHAFGVAWWRQFQKLPRSTQDYCLHQAHEPKTAKHIHGPERAQHKVKSVTAAKAL